MTNTVTVDTPVAGVAQLIPHGPMVDNVEKASVGAGGSGTAEGQLRDLLVVRLAHLEDEELETYALWDNLVDQVDAVADQLCTLRSRLDQLTRERDRAARQSAASRARRAELEYLLSVRP
jgi:hypothetical protein